MGKGATGERVEIDIDANVARLGEESRMPSQNQSPPPAAASEPSPSLWATSFLSFLLKIFDRNPDFFLSDPETDPDAEPCELRRSFLLIFDARSSVDLLGEPGSEGVACGEKDADWLRECVVDGGNVAGG